MSIDMIAMIKKELAADDAVAASGQTTLDYSPQEISHRLHYLLEKLEQAEGNALEAMDDTHRLERELAEARECNRQLGQAHIDVSSYLDALRERHDAAHDNWMTAERLAASKQDELDALRERHDEVVEQRDEARYKLDKLRERYAAEVEQAFREGFINFDGFGSSETDAAWLASDAKARLP